MRSHQVANYPEAFQEELEVIDFGESSILYEGQGLAHTRASITEVFPLVIERAL